MTEQFIVKHFLILIFIVSGVFVPLSLQLSPARAGHAQFITYELNTVYAAWDDWRSKYITNWRAGESPRVRVLGGVSEFTTVSEGQAYGILLASLFDDQETLDGLWLFTADHQTDNGLMHWHIHQHGEIFGTGAATDGDLDMAIGLVTACEKVRYGTWVASKHGLDYCALATDLITALYDHTVDHPGEGPAAGLDDNFGYELIPGDQWNMREEFPNGIVNLSYFSPGYFRVFAEFTDDERWYNVIERNYALANVAQALPGNCSDLIPNWTTYDGRPQFVDWQPEQYEQWSYDAFRFAWRVAVDKYWFNDAEASQTMNEIGGFFASVGMQNVRAEYRLDGTAIKDYHNPIFVSAAAVSIWAADDPIATDCGDASGTLQSDAQEGYDMLADYEFVDYYSDSWRLLTLVLMADMFPNPLEEPVFRDVNRDGLVTPSDANLIISNIGQQPEGDLVNADVDNNGIINGDDFNRVLFAIGIAELTPR
ncbi:MAG: glycosyl hydrolase family 8 [Chloroflexota bacterium]